MNFEFPKIRKVFPELIARSSTSAQPMARPNGAIFHMSYNVSATGFNQWSHLLFVKDGWRYDQSAQTFAYTFFLYSLEEGKTEKYQRFEVRDDMPCENWGTVVPDNWTTIISIDGFNPSIEQLNVQLREPSSYLIPLPGVARDHFTASIVAQRLGNHLAELGCVPMPSFEDLAILAIEVCGDVPDRHQQEE